eukprot:CAMPEP_0194025912 /NCGR_PEP_ID=MMETSP0009_2-20130614/205_1 /TAXON_ID=210454 /ORGANISM="Grammatophora oceanica, Strain CCMP 410" /LENGTH=59 /DNA_ID=CAMNT_0038664305 /DNA_START=62 /DNA_END=238 /DNA_ORIENTATION=+
MTKRHRGKGDDGADGGNTTRWELWKKDGDWSNESDEVVGRIKGMVKDRLGGHILPSELR